MYNSTGPVPVSVSFDGVVEGTRATLTILTAPSETSYSDIGEDVVSKTVTRLTAAANGAFSFELPNLSVSVLEVFANNASFSTKRGLGT